ncbi:hypothetical protein NL676_007839 [Syzygium grande]|nr:hypothetical protein NL676_007839 [Syzygium grande]
MGDITGGGGFVRVKVREGGMIANHHVGSYADMAYLFLSLPPFTASSPPSPTVRSVTLPPDPSRALELVVVLVEEHDTVLLACNLFVTSRGLMDLKRFAFRCKGRVCSKASHAMKRPSSVKSKAAFARGQGSVVGVSRRASAIFQICVESKSALVHCPRLQI